MKKKIVRKSSLHTHSFGSHPHQLFRIIYLWWWLHLYNTKADKAVMPSISW